MQAPTEPLARVLVVDDEEALVAALCDTLNDQHYEARGFTSARAVEADEIPRPEASE